jgi:hypothetical protein
MDDNVELIARPLIADAFLQSRFSRPTKADCRPGPQTAGNDILAPHADD